MTRGNTRILNRGGIFVCVCDLARQLASICHFAAIVRELSASSALWRRMLYIAYHKHSIIQCLKIKEYILNVKLKMAMGYLEV